MKLGRQVSLGPGHTVLDGDPVRVWKLKEEQTCEEYKSMVRDKVEEAEWKHLDVNEHWCRMKR